MFCPACGQQTPPQGRFCLHCGADQEPFRATPQAPATTTQTLANKGLQAALEGEFELQDEIGHGDTSVVYRAREIALERIVALKMLRRSFLQEPLQVSRFQAQIQLAAQLEHPHITRLYAQGRQAGLSYCTLSLIPGGSLQRRLQVEGAQPVEAIASWGQQLCAALAHAHARAMIHRAVRPGHILLDAAGQAVLTAFAPPPQEEGDIPTGEGALAYMSPEQAKGQEPSAQSDMYSLGVVLYELATGSPPFAGSDPVSMAYQHVHEAPQPPDRRNPELAAWLGPIILHCLAKDPQRRYSAAALGQALAAYQQPQLSPKAGSPNRRAPTNRAAQPAVKPPVPPPSSRRRKMLLFLLVILALAGGGWMGRQWEVEKGRDHLAQMRRQVDLQQRQARQLLGQVQENQQDDEAYVAAQQSGIAPAYEAYLAAYPQGRHAQQALQQLAELGLQGQRDQQQQAQQAQDSLAYSQARQQGTRLAYETYIEQYPQGLYLPHAMQALAALTKPVAPEPPRAREPAQPPVTAPPIAPLAANPSPPPVSSPNSGQMQSFTLSGTTTLEMVWIDAGSFTMGSAAEEAGRQAVEGPQYEVFISRGFWLGKYEVTQEQWRAVVGNNPSFYSGPQRPVESVSREDVDHFLRRLNSTAGQITYRLPSEAEWEYACRAGSRSRWSFGDDERLLPAHAKFIGNNTLRRFQ